MPNRLGGRTTIALTIDRRAAITVMVPGGVDAQAVRTAALWLDANPVRGGTITRLPDGSGATLAFDARVLERVQQRAAAYLVGDPDQQLIAEFDLGGAERAVDDLYACLATLDRDDRGSGQPVATPSTWCDCQAAITSDDYPVDALRAGVQGTTRTRVTITARGYVGDCTVVGSSGSASLDLASCRLLLRRARFKPATGADGRPTVETAEKTVRWQLPS